MTPDRLGTGPGPVLSALEQIDDTRTGSEAVAEFEGSLSECQLKRQVLMNMGASQVSLRDKRNGYWTVQARFPHGFNGETTIYNEVPSVHELDTNIAQVSIYRASKVRSLLIPAHLGIVSTVVSDYQTGIYAKTSTQSRLQVAEADLTAQIIAAGSSAPGRTNAQAQADALSLFRAIACLGVEDKIEYTTVYKRTLTAATPLQVRASFEGVGKIWTTSEVQAFEALDPSGWFVLDVNAQWLKSKPQVIASSNQKTQVVYSYTECQIAFGLAYDAYASAVLLYPPAP